MRGASLAGRELLEAPGAERRVLAAGELLAAAEHRHETRRATRATPAHTQTRAKSVIAGAVATAPTTKLHAAYMPTGNTVDQRRTL